MCIVLVFVGVVAIAILVCLKEKQQYQRVSPTEARRMEARWKEAASRRDYQNDFQHSDQSMSSFD
jgi:hypothetical protein